jgi:hypothetical protein
MDGMLEQLKEEAAHFEDEIEEAVHERIEEEKIKITDFGHKKIKILIDELHEDLPIFERAGYKLHNLEVELGLSPKLIPYFKIEKHISEEEQKALLDEVKQKRIVHALLSSLFKSAYLQKVLRIGGLEFFGLKVELAAVPTVHLLFR